jgi:hypothetical protein
MGCFGAALAAGLFSDSELQEVMSAITGKK